MSVYYYNGAQILAPFTITSNEPMFDMTTVSLKTQRASQGHQRWELSFDVLAENSNQADLFISSFKDVETSDSMIMPQLTSATTQTTTTPLFSSSIVGVNQNVLTLPAGPGNAAAGASSVTVQKGTSQITGLMPKGTFIKFSSHDKVYITTADVTFNDIDNKTIYIYPKLKAAVNNSQGHTMKMRDLVTFSYYRNIDNQTGITFTDGVISNIGNVKLIEVM